MTAPARATTTWAATTAATGGGTGGTGGGDIAGNDGVEAPFPDRW